MPRASSNRSIYNSADLKMLQTEHQTLEERLMELDRDLALSPEEKYEAQFIRKRKLFLKDRMHLLQPRD